MKLTKIRSIKLPHYNQEYVMEYMYQYPFYFDSMINNEIHLVIRL